MKVGKYAGPTASNNNAFIPPTTPALHRSTAVLHTLECYEAGTIQKPKVNMEGTTILGGERATCLRKDHAGVS